MKSSREQLVRFATVHRYSLACGIMFASSLFLWPAFYNETQGDLAHYQLIAEGLFDGNIPYRDRAVEYPPYSVPIFLMPLIWGHDNYFDGFVTFAFAADCLMKMLLFFAGSRFSRTAFALVPLLLYCVATPFMRYFFLQRYDLYPALICLAAIWLFYSKRFFLCGLAIAVGTGVKLYPVLFVPPLFILAWRQQKSGRFIWGLMAGLLPIALISFFLPWWQFAQFQANRGLQVESLYASLLWFGKLLGLLQLTWVYTKAWFEVHGTAASDLLPWSRLMFAGTVIISMGLTAWAACRLKQVTLPQLARILLLPLLAFVAFNQVLSPQYMIWLLSLAAVTVLDRILWVGIGIFIVTIMTPIIYPSWHGDYGIGLDLFETTFLLLRNLILVALWIFLFRLILREVKWGATSSKSVL